MLQGVRNSENLGWYFRLTARRKKRVDFLNETCSKKPSLGERKGFCQGRDDEMIEYAHIDEVERLLERAGEEFVCRAWLACAGRVVVSQNDRCCVVPEG